MIQILPENGHKIRLVKGDDRKKFFMKLEGMLDLGWSIKWETYREKNSYIKYEVIAVNDMRGG